MKKLKDILYGVAIESIVGSTGIVIEAIQFDSRKVQNGVLFVAQKGVVSDGHDFIPMAIEKGAVAIVCETLPEHCKTGMVYVVVPQTINPIGTEW